MRRQSHLVRVLVVVLAVAAVQAFPAAAGRSIPKPKASCARTEAAAAQPAAAQCDATLWNHVYHPTRLIKKQASITVTGTIVDATANQPTHHADGMRHEADGDTHGWLELDPQFTKLSNAGNSSNEGGNMVFEVVCKYPINAAKEPAAVTACKGYHSPIVIPALGSHVAVTGTPLCWRRITPSGWRSTRLLASWSNRQVAGMLLDRHG
jgi:hypothetical protein